LNRMIHQFDAWGATLLFLGAMSACWGLGWRSSCRRSPEDQGYDPALKFTDASMASHGLSLAFWFAMVGGRHDGPCIVTLAA
jgi:hypothetical protein